MSNVLMELDDFFNAIKGKKKKNCLSFSPVVLKQKEKNIIFVLLMHI